MASTLDHLEKTLADNYRKEIDQEENVWRSLPFFAATLALQLAAVVGLAEKLPSLTPANRWWIVVPVVITAAATLSTLLLMAAAIRTARFRYIAAEPDLRDYALRLDAAEQANAAVVSAIGDEQERSVDGEQTPKVDALATFRGELSRQYALASKRPVWARAVRLGCC